MAHLFMTNLFENGEISTKKSLIRILSTGEKDPSHPYMKRTESERGSKPNIFVLLRKEAPRSPEGTKNGERIVWSIEHWRYWREKICF